MTLARTVRKQCAFLLPLAVILGLRTAAASTSIRPLELSGAALPNLVGVPIARLSLLRCDSNGCQPIPFQVDERTADDQWVLDEGPQPLLDQPPQVFDENDLLLWMAEDAGTAADPIQLPPHRAAAEIDVHDEAGHRRVYLLDCRGDPPRSPIRYVSYDPSTDLMRAPRVALGFERGLPDRLLINAGADELDLLERFRIGAEASLVWGLLRFRRDHTDLRTELVGWHRGAIRVIRHQRQTVRLGWGIRAPVFAVYTFFHRDFAELPVGLWLNHRPTYFFTDIQLELMLDFTDLRGWRLDLPSPQPSQTIGDREEEQRFDLSEDWFAVRNEQITLLTALELSRSLQTTHRQLIYRFARDGQRTALGYRLDHWDEVGAGGHELKAVTYALPAGADVTALLADRGRASVGEVHSVP